MRGLIGLFSILVVTGSVLAVTPAEVRALRQERKPQRPLAGVDKGRVEFLYKFQNEYVTLAAQAARRGSEAAGAWAKFDKKSKAVAVLARSPFGGGESAASYWPFGVKDELLKNVVEPLKKAGFKKVILSDILKRDTLKRENREAKSEKGFPEGYEFVLVIGLHHEPVPHRGSRRKVDGKVVYSRSSRVNAWAILFHAPTATAFWCTTATAGVNRRNADDPLNTAAERAMAALDFTGIGADNIPGHIKKLAEPGGFLNTLDIAAMLAQTQRADAAEGIVKVATSVASVKNTVRVVRYVSQKGEVQDYRTDRAVAVRRKHVEMAQLVMMRVLLLEHLRGFRGIQPCAVLARTSKHSDFRIPRIGRRQVGRLMPLSADDEIVLLAELANADFSRRNKKRTKELLWITRIAAVGNLGRCRVRIDEARVVAKIFAERKIPKPRRGRKPRLDKFKEAGIDALKELNKPVKPKVQ